jgi:hypothetical protein
MSISIFRKSRLFAVTDRYTTFTWKEYGNNGKMKEMTLSNEEFLRRFLLHVLPYGLTGLRHYGLGMDPKLCTANIKKMSTLRVHLNSDHRDHTLQDKQANAGAEKQLRCRSPAVTAHDNLLFIMGKVISVMKY